MTHESCPKDDHVIDLYKEETVPLIFQMYPSSFSTVSADSLDGCTFIYMEEVREEDTEFWRIDSCLKKWRKRDERGIVDDRERREGSVENSVVF